MGDKISVTITKQTRRIIFNTKMVVCFNSSGEVIHAYELTRGNELNALVGRDIEYALDRHQIGGVSGVSTFYEHHFKNKGFYSADVADYSKSGSAQLVLAIHKDNNIITKAKGVAD